MTSWQNIIDRTRSYLMTGQQDRLNILDANITAAATTLVCRNEVKGITVGTTISIGLEDMLVTAVGGTSPGSTITVYRGESGSGAPAYRGTVNSTHEADELIRVNPEFTDHRIMLEVLSELEDLSSPSSGLYAMDSVEFTFVPSQRGYNLPATNLIDVWRVRYDVPGPTQEWPLLRREDWYVDQDANTTDFASGNQILLRRGGYPGHTVRVSYKKKFTVPALDSTLAAALNTADVASVTGMHEEALHLLSLGAAISVNMGRDIKRSFMSQQPEPRRSSEVGGADAQRAMQSVVAQYVSGISQEADRLLNKYPEQI